MDRDTALSRTDTVIDAAESKTLPVSVHEVWVYGDAALGFDPLDRLDVHTTKDTLLRDDPDAAESFERSHGIRGAGKSIRVKWVHEYSDLLRANTDGHAAPEKCLAAHLLPDEESVHPKVCNASFEGNVTQRLRGVVEHEAYKQILDPRGVCLYADGQRSPDATPEFRNSEFAFPTLSGTLETLGLEDDDTETVVEVMRAYRVEQTGTSVHGDVV